MDITPQRNIEKTVHEPIGSSTKKPNLNDNLLGIELSSTHKTRNSILSIAGLVILILLILAVSHSMKQNSGISAAANSSSVQNDSNSSVLDNSANASSQSLAQSEADLKAAQDKAAAAQAAADQAMANLNNISTAPPSYVPPTYNSSLSTSSSGTSTNSGYNTVSNSQPSQTNIAPDCTAYSSQIQQLNSNQLGATAKLNADYQAFSTPGGFNWAGLTAAQAAAYAQNILNQDQQAINNANTAINNLKSQYPGC